MRLYIDDDLAAHELIAYLRHDGHDVIEPKDVNHSGDPDPVHLLEATRDKRAILTRNYKDFQWLHHLVIGTGGHHAGVLVMRYENNPRRDPTYRGLANAVRKYESSGLNPADQYVHLNPFR